MTSSSVFPIPQRLVDLLTISVQQLEDQISPNSHAFLQLAFSPEKLPYANNGICGLDQISVLLIGRAPRSHLEIASFYCVSDWSNTLTTWEG